jgi:hypothetical protein
MLLFLASSAIAGDFHWVGDFNVRARANPVDFRARLSNRFQAGDEQISAVIDDVSKPSDAYIVLRLGEISALPLDRVMAEYEFCRKKGWDVIAKRLGIRPESREYRKLKAGQDLYGGNDPAREKAGHNRKSVP